MPALPGPIITIEAHYFRVWKLLTYNEGTIYMHIYPFTIHLFLFCKPQWVQSIFEGASYVYTPVLSRYIFIQSSHATIQNKLENDLKNLWCRKTKMLLQKLDSRHLAHCNFNTNCTH